MMYAVTAFQLNFKRTLDCARRVAVVVVERESYDFAGRTLGRETALAIAYGHVLYALVVDDFGDFDNDLFL